MVYVRWQVREKMHHYNFYYFYYYYFISLLPSDIIFNYTKRKENVNQSLIMVIYGTENTQVRTGH